MILKGLVILALGLCGGVAHWAFRDYLGWDALPFFQVLFWVTLGGIMGGIRFGYDEKDPK